MTGANRGPTFGSLKLSHSQFFTHGRTHMDIRAIEFRFGSA